MSKRSAIILSCSYILSCVLISGCSPKNSRDIELLSYDASSNGDALLAEGKTDAAIKEYQEACHLNPSSWRSHYKLATAYEKSGEIDSAIAEYREVVKIHYPTSNPSYYAYSHFWLAQALDEKGSHDEARKEYLTAYKIASQDKKHNKKLLAMAQQSKHCASQ